MYQVDQTMSLMIPRVFPQWVDESIIRNTFESQKIGIMGSVQILFMKRESKKQGHPIYKAIVHFKEWYNSIVVHNLQQRILSVGNARVVYDDPWYWVVMKNTKTKTKTNANANANANVRKELLSQDQEYMNFLDIRQWGEGGEGSSSGICRFDNGIVTEEYAMRSIGGELDLTETAMNCAERVLRCELGGAPAGSRLETYLM